MDIWCVCSGRSALCSRCTRRRRLSTKRTHTHAKQTNITTAEKWAAKKQKHLTCDWREGTSISGKRMHHLFDYRYIIICDGNQTSSSVHMVLYLPVKQLNRMCTLCVCVYVLLLTKIKQRSLLSGNRGKIKRCRRNLYVFRRCKCFYVHIFKIYSKKISLKVNVAYYGS